MKRKLMAGQNYEQSNVCQCVSLGDSCSLILCTLVVAITFDSCLWNLIPLLCGFQTAAIHAHKETAATGPFLHQYPHLPDSKGPYRVETNSELYVQ